MDAKRCQSLRKVSTPAASKLRMSKTQSQASFTPRRLNEENKGAIGDKNPLDALSRAAMRPTIERRSGLQDIDEEYFAKLNLSPPDPPRYDHAAGQRTANPISQADTNVNKLQAGGAAQQVQPIAQQVTIAQEQIHAQPAKIMQMAQLKPAAVDVNASQQQQQEIPRQQVNYSPATGEPDMCTTCPNCQTVIYLAPLNAEPPMGNVAAGMHGQPDGTAIGAGKC